jgi:hypothetical protein
MHIAKSLKKPTHKTKLVKVYGCPNSDRLRKIKHENTTACISHCWQRVAVVITLGYLVVTRPQSALATQRLIHAGVSCKANFPNPSLHSDLLRALKSLAALPCNHPFAAKHMLFCPPRLRHLSSLS